MHKSIKWGIVAALGLVGAGCTLATVDLTDRGAQEHGYTVDQHIVEPWRIVPPVSTGHQEEEVDEGFCADTPEGQICTRSVTTTSTIVDRYSAASKRGAWPLTVGLEYVCERSYSIIRESPTPTLDGVEITDPNVLVHVPLPTSHNTDTEYKTYVYYTLGGFTPGEGQVILFTDGAEVADGLDIKGEAGKYIEITDEMTVGSVRFAEATVEAVVVRNQPYPDGKQPGSVTFEMRGARSKFEQVDRLCYNG